MPDIYNEPVIYRHGDNIAEIYHPILTDEERARRMEQIKKAATRLILYGYKN